MSQSSSNDGSSGNGGGLDNLFALAHLAAMTEEERGAATTTASSRSHGKSSLTVATSSSSSGASTRTPSPGNRDRRPAKKRAVPSEFDSKPQAQEEVGDKADAAAMASQVTANSTKTKATTSSSATSKSKSKSATRRTNQSPGHNKSRNQRGSGTKGSNTFKMKANQPSFPVILMAIMSAPQNKEYITFLSDGESFIIIHPGALARNVLPIHFEENVPTYDQFLYLLAIWGFEVIKDPQYPNVNVYKHPQFRKGDWEACLEMKLPNLNDNDIQKKPQAKNDPSATQQSSQGSTAAAAHRCRPASPPVAHQVDNAVPPTPMTARSVTPPMAEVMDIANGMPPMPVGIHQSLSSTAAGPQTMKEKNMMYLRMLQLQDQMGISGGMHGQAAAASFLHQPRLQSSASLGYYAKHSSNGMTSNNMMRGRMPMNHRRATLDMPPSAMMMRNAMPRNPNRRATLDMPPSSSASMFMRNNMNAASSMPSRNISPPFAAPGFLQGHPQGPPMQGQVQSSVPPSTPSDAEVRSATQDIVSKAMDVLRPAKARRLTVDQPPSLLGNNTARLDAMTDLFLERSMARLNSRPVSLMGPRNNVGQQQQQHSALPSLARRATISTAEDVMRHQSLAMTLQAEVEAQAKANLAAAEQRRQAHRKVSLLGGNLPMGYQN